MIFKCPLTGISLTRQDQDEDFVSESYQASSSDIAEVDKSMKKLTTGGGKGI